LLASINSLAADFSDPLSLFINEARIYLEKGVR
jgi:hypothetical protein